MKGDLDDYVPEIQLFPSIVERFEKSYYVCCKLFYICCLFVIAFIAVAVYVRASKGFAGRTVLGTC